MDNSISCPFSSRVLFKQADKLLDGRITDLRAFARLGEAGVRGLHGGPERLARARKARLVEYAVAARLVTASDLELLPDASRA